MKTIKTFLALAALATAILTQSCSSIKEASTFEDCPQYEEDGYHTTICWDQKRLTDES